MMLSLLLHVSELNKSYIIYLYLYLYTYFIFVESDLIEYFKKFGTVVDAIVMRDK